MSRIPEVGALVAGRYRIRGVASDGPGYLTLHAFDREVEVEVSLLWFRPGLFPDRRTRESFLGDAVRTRGIAHPHLRRLYEAHLEGDSIFVAAQVGHANQILRRLESSRPLDELEVIRYASAVGQGLEVAHRVGAVHGYLVPTDVIEVASQIKVSGVGLFASASADVARDLFWTRRKYIAPEVLQGDLPTPASDVYSMAALLTELASGQSSATLSESSEALAGQHIRLADIFARATRADPADRTQTVAALLGEVRHVVIDDRVPTSERMAVRPSSSVPDLLADYHGAPTLVDHGRIEDDDDDGTKTSVRRADSEEGVTVARQRPPLLDPNPVSLIDAGGDPMGDDEPVRGPADEDLTTQYHQAAPETDDDDDLEAELIVVDTPPPARSEIPFDLNPQTIQGVAPPGAFSRPSAAPAAALDPAPADPKPPAPDAASTAHVIELESEPASFDVDLDITEPPFERPKFVSHKPSEPETPRTPHIPVLERPDGQVKVRSIASQAPPSTAPKKLGNYAPPRAETKLPPAPRKRGLLFFLWTFAGVLAIVLGGLIAVVVVRADKTKKTVAIDAGVGNVDASLVIIDAAPPSPCGEDMALVGEGDARFCIDLYEAPGKGKVPATQVGHGDAQARCESRGARLCSNAEWQLACGGPDELDYPYGKDYEKGRCNGGRGVRNELAPAGSFPTCVSPSGAFDMSGNVAEWSSDQFVQGGSARDRSAGRCARRYRGSRREEGYPDVGYRCCSAPDPAALAPAEPKK